MMKSLMDAGVCLGLLAASGMIAYEALNPSPVSVRRAVMIPSQPVSLEGVSFKGAANAPVVMLAFSDSECPFSADFTRNTLPTIVARYVIEGDVKVGVRLFPVNRQSPRALSAAAAAECARHQGMFWKMHDMLFEKSPMHSREAVIGYAKAIGLDPNTFTSAYDSSAAQVNADIAQGDAAGVEATPTLFFNDRKYEGPMHPKYIAMWIDEELAVNR